MRKFLTNCDSVKANELIDRLKTGKPNRIIVIDDPVPASGTNSTVESLKSVNIVGIYDIIKE